MEMKRNYVMYQSNRSLNISPPWAYPEHLTPVPAWEGGHLITTQRVGNFIAYKFKGKDCVFCAGLVENQRPTQAVFRIWCLRTIFMCITFN